jgi:hypothetical protein
VRLKNGKESISVSEDKHTLENYRFTASAGRIDEHGRLVPPEDALASLDLAITIEAVMIQRPEIKASVVLEPNYGCGMVVDGTAKVGEKGEDGLNGCCLNSAETDVDPRHTGKRGGDGGAGGVGRDAGPLVVDLDYIPSKHGKLVHARGYIEGEKSDVVFLPSGPRLKIRNSGGSGGPGGNAGNGGRGGIGYVKGCSRPGQGGQGGDGGRGGRGGQGGPVLVRFADNAPELQKLVEITNGGGPGGEAGLAGRGGPIGTMDNSEGGDPTKCDTGYGEYGPDGRGGEAGPAGANGSQPIFVATGPAQLFVGDLASVSWPGGMPARRRAAQAPGPVRGGVPAARAIPATGAPVRGRAAATAAAPATGASRGGAATSARNVAITAAAEQVRAHGGGDLSVAAFDVRDGARPVFHVGKDGTVEIDGRASMRVAGGVISTSGGEAMFAVDAANHVWTASGGRLVEFGHFEGARLVTTDRLTVEVDPQGRVLVSKARDIELSREKLSSVPARNRRAATLLAAILSSRLHFERKKP